MTVFDLWSVPGLNWAYRRHQGCRRVDSGLAFSWHVMTQVCRYIHFIGAALREMGLQLHHVPGVLISRISLSPSAREWWCAGPGRLLRYYNKRRVWVPVGLSKPFTIPAMFVCALGKLLDFCKAELEHKPLWYFAHPVIPLFCHRLQRSDTNCKLHDYPNLSNSWAASCLRRKTENHLHTIRQVKAKQPCKSVCLISSGTVAIY